jgi:hypothetical protein
MGRHVTSLPDSATDLPSAYGLEDGATIIWKGTTWYVKANNWVMGGTAGESGLVFDASRKYYPGELVARNGVLYACYTETNAGPFAKGYWQVVANQFVPSGVWVEGESGGWVGRAYQHDGKLWHAVVDNVYDAPSATAMGVERVAYLQTNGMGGMAVNVSSAAYLAFPFAVFDPMGDSDFELHSATHLLLRRDYPMTVVWSAGDVYRLVTRDDYEAALAGGGSLLDIPTVEDLTLEFADDPTTGGNTTVRLKFAAEQPRFPRLRGPGHDQRLRLHHRPDRCGVLHPELQPGGRGPERGRGRVPVLLGGRG